MNSFTAIISIAFYSVLGIVALAASPMLSTEMAVIAASTIVVSSVLLQTCFVYFNRSKEEIENEHERVSYETRAMACGLISIMSFGMSLVSLAYGLIV